MMTCAVRAVMREFSSRLLNRMGSWKADGLSESRHDGRNERELGGSGHGVASFFSRWDLVLFCLGLLGIAFAYGVAVGKYNVFPHTEINRAADALKDWRQNWRHYLGLHSRYLLPTARTAGGVTVLNRDAASPGYTFLTMYRDGRYGASLIDLNGTDAAHLGRGVQRRFSRAQAPRAGAAGHGCFDPRLGTAPERRRHPQLWDAGSGADRPLLAGRVDGSGRGAPRP